jgi:hypothetical protein
MRSLKICEKVEAVDGSKYKNGTTIVAVSMVKRQILLKPLCSEGFKSYLNCCIVVQSPFSVWVTPMDVGAVW